MMMDTAPADHSPAELGRRRYFITVHTADPRVLRRLADFNLDLFQATARTREDGASIEGLVSMADVARLVDAGYRVTIEADERSRMRATETAGLREWLTELGEV